MLEPIKRRISVGKFRSKDGLGVVDLANTGAGGGEGVVVSVVVSWEIFAETGISPSCD